MHIAIGTIAMIAGLVCLGTGGFYTIFGDGDELSPEAGNYRFGGCAAVPLGIALLGFGYWMVL